MSRMKAKESERPLSIGVYLNRKSKASREQTAGIFRFAGEHPNWELHFFTRPDSMAEMQRLTRSFAPDGIIAGHPAVIAAFRRRFRRRIPGVLIDFAPVGPSVPDALVACDDHAIGACAANLFLKRGYRSFAFAGIEGGSGDSDAVNSLNRENGFRRALRKAGHACAAYHERLPQNSWRYADAAALTRWLRELPKPCALLAHSDLLAQSVLAASRRARIPVPEQIAVIGVDNEDSVCESCSPRLSSIEPDFANGGYLAADILNRMIGLGGSPILRARATYGILKTVERMSTQNVTGSHLRVAKARELIRTEYAAGIRPEDVAEALGVSVRMLELVFRKTLGHTLREELVARRVAEARRLLEKTTLPLGEVAVACGFRTLAALKSIFRKRVGCSMRAYRKTRRDPLGNASDPRPDAYGCGDEMP